MRKDADLDWSSLRVEVADDTAKVLWSRIVIAIKTTGVRQEHQFRTFRLEFEYNCFRAALWVDRNLVAVAIRAVVIIAVKRGIAILAGLLFPIARPLS